MTKTLSAAIVGMGNWGQTLVNAVQGRSDRIKFVAGTTRTPERAAAFAERQGIALLPDLDAVLRRDDIEAVVLATPHSQHLSQIEAAAAAGRHVFSEKPLTLTGAEAVAAYAAADRAGVVLAVGHNRRFLPAYRRLHEIVSNEIGALRQVIGNFSWGASVYRPGSWRKLGAESPAGGMAGLGIHMVDAMVGLGFAAEQVTVLSRRDPEGHSHTVTALMEGGPTLGMLTTMSGPGRFWRLECFGSEGWAAMDGEHALTFAKAGGPEQRLTFSWTDMERAELEGFAAAVRGETAYPITAEQGIADVHLFEAICRAEAEADQTPSRTGVAK